MLQKKVGMYKALGNAGTLSRGGAEKQNTAIAIDENVVVGGFVKQNATTKNHEVLGASGQAITAGDVIVGLCSKDRLIQTNTTPVVGYPKGSQVAYWEKGSVYFLAKTEAKLGQKVYLKNADGSVVFSNDENLADHTFTGFVVTLEGGAESIIEISK